MYSLIATSLAAFSLVSHGLADGSCDCYQTSSGDTFSSYQFLDFRKGKPSNFDSFFTILDVPDYKGNSVTNSMTTENVAFSDGAMTLTTKNTGSGLQQSADIYSKTSMLYGSFRMSAKITGDAGAVAGFFVYLDADNEADIELLTNEASDQIHYTTHDNGGNTGGTANPTLNTTFSGTRSDFNTYRFDWISSKVSFIINSDPPKTLTSAVPTKPCTLDLNMWSCGDGWGGAMAAGQSAVMEVQWIEALYGGGTGTGTGTEATPVSSAAGRAKTRTKRSESQQTDTPPQHRREVGKRQTSGSSCANPCKVDGVAQVGVPEPA